MLYGMSVPPHKFLRDMVTKYQEIGARCYRKLCRLNPSAANVGVTT
jgi:hypothetical protein